MRIGPYFSEAGIGGGEGKSRQKEDAKRWNTWKWGTGGRSWGLCSDCGMWRVRRVGYWNTRPKIEGVKQSREEKGESVKGKKVVKGKKGKEKGIRKDEEAELDAENKQLGIKGRRKYWVGKDVWDEKVLGWKKGVYQQCPDCYCEERKKEDEDGDEQ